MTTKSIGISSKDLYNWNHNKAFFSWSWDMTQNVKNEKINTNKGIFFTLNAERVIFNTVNIFILS